MVRTWPLFACSIMLSRSHHINLLHEIGLMAHLGHLWTIYPWDLVIVFTITPLCFCYIGLNNIFRTQWILNFFLLVEFGYLVRAEVYLQIFKWFLISLPIWVQLIRLIIDIRWRLCLLKHFALNTLVCIGILCTIKQYFLNRVL